MTIRFEEAWTRCFDVLRGPSADVLKDAGKIVVVRDLLGRARLAMERPPDAETLEPLMQALRVVAGPFFSEKVLDGRAMVAPEAVFDSPDAFEKEPGIWALERLVTGADWGRGQLRRTPRRVRGFPRSRHGVGYD